MGVDNGDDRFVGNLAKFRQNIGGRCGALCGVDNDQALICLDHRYVGRGESHRQMDIIIDLINLFGKMRGMRLHYAVSLALGLLHHGFFSHSSG